MKPLAEYTVADWTHLRPLTHFLKTQSYRRRDRRYIRLSARGGDLDALRRIVRGQKILVTVAFADAQAIEWQARLVRRYVPHALYVIADNSPDDASAAAIAALAERLQISYLRLPRNPCEAGSRSHGIALNWLWHNLLLPGEPAMFGFLDDDLFPTAPDDPFTALQSQAWFGVVRPAASRWFLWAGFCFFRFEAVRNKALDFGQDWFNGLDTGGGNWRTLYRFADRAQLRDAATRFVPFKLDIETAEGPFQWCGNWLHEVGQMGREELMREKRQIVAELLQPHLIAADYSPAEETRNSKQ